MGVHIKDLKLKKIRKEISILDDNGLPLVKNDKPVTIKVYNPIGEKRIELLTELQFNKEVNGVDEKEFVKTFYNYLLENFTDIKVGKTDIESVFDSPKPELIEVKKEIEGIISEVCVENLVSRISQLNNMIVAMHTEIMIKKMTELESLQNEINQMDVNINGTEINRGIE